MNDHILIPLHELSAYELETIYEDFESYFRSQDEFLDFVNMQIKYYPRGVKAKDFGENVASFAMNSAMAALSEKIGLGVVKEHQTDSGDIFYSLGEIGIDFGVDPEYYIDRPSVE